MLLFVTALISGLSMCALASWFLAKNYSIYAPDWIPVATLCLCIFCDSSGLQPLSVVITGEMFSFKVRRDDTFDMELSIHLLARIIIFNNSIYGWSENMSSRIFYYVFISLSVPAVPRAIVLIDFKVVRVYLAFETFFFVLNIP